MDRPSIGDGFRLGLGLGLGLLLALLLLAAAGFLVAGLLAQYPPAVGLGLLLEEQWHPWRR